jgi:hypothetical protein
MDRAKAWAKEAVDVHPKFLAMGAELETFSALAERRKDWLSNKECEFVTRKWPMEPRKNRARANRTR